MDTAQRHVYVLTSDRQQWVNEWVGWRCVCVCLCVCLSVCTCVCRRLEQCYAILTHRSDVLCHWLELTTYTKNLMISSRMLLPHLSHTDWWQFYLHRVSSRMLLSHLSHTDWWQFYLHHGGCFTWHLSVFFLPVSNIAEKLSTDFDIVGGVSVWPARID